VGGKYLRKKTGIFFEFLFIVYITEDEEFEKCTENNDHRDLPKL